MNIQTMKYAMLKLLTALLLLPMVSACGLVTDDYDDLPNVPDAVNYINITISVRASGSETRGNTPQGGEEGDGREKGINTRENEVDGVTLIFFQDKENTSAGINATAANAATTTIDYAVYYTVTLDDNYVPKYGTHYTDEIYYTTGDQELALTSLNSNNKYHLLVVANADLTSQITPGTTTLAQVRDMTLSSVYTGTGIGENASKFVMSSEKDHILDFSYSTYDETNNRRTFQLDNVHIERMSARIDFWAKGSTGYSTEYDHNGYVYSIGMSDCFVLTSITPFNMNMGTGNEYLFKRTSNSVIEYLADETTTSWVIDAYYNNETKTSNAHPTWMVSTLTSVENNLANDYNITMQACQSAKQTVGAYDDIIVAYPKENTLMPASLLYYHATGLAFEGYYYRNGATTGGERQVFYHYLRHQGESESYDAIKTLDKTATCGQPEAAPAMNYGVVRNNIYRVSIEGINQQSGHIKIKIEEEKWRHVDNPAIYI